MHTIDIEHNFCLTQLNSFGLISITKYYLILNHISQLTAISNFIIHQKYFILGGGSNILLSSFYDGVIIHNRLKGINKVAEDHNYYYVVAAAGEIWDDFVLTSLNHNWFGLENLSLIPGVVGASPIQNIGAYGAEVKDFIYQIKVFDFKLNIIKTMNNQECEFAYRDSKLKHTKRYMVLEVGYRLLKVPQLNLAYHDLSNQILATNPLELRKIIIELRQLKLPDPHKIGNVGSFFHNPIISIARLIKLKNKYPQLVSYSLDKNKAKISAAWLIDQLGLKSYQKNGVAIYHKHALILINCGSPNIRNVLEFASHIQQQIFYRYHIQLNIEPIIL